MCTYYAVIPHHSLYTDKKLRLIPHLRELIITSNFNLYTLFHKAQLRVIMHTRYHSSYYKILQRVKKVEILVVYLKKEKKEKRAKRNSTNRKEVYK